MSNGYEKIWLVSTVGPGAKLLTPFLKYYTKLGISNFIIITHFPNKDFSHIRSIRVNLDDLVLPNLIHKVWIGEFSEDQKVRNERKYIEEICDENDWVVYADIDEFHEFPFGIIHEINKCKKGYIEGRIVDRISPDGKLIYYDPLRPLELQFPLGAEITHYLLGAWDKKIVAAKAYRVVGGGHHLFLKKDKNAQWMPGPYKRRIPWYHRRIAVHHFKWNLSAITQMQKHLLLDHPSLEAWKIEAKRFLDYYEKYKRININEKKFRVRYIGQKLFC